MHHLHVDARLRPRGLGVRLVWPRWLLIALVPTALRAQVAPAPTGTTSSPPVALDSTALVTLVRELSGTPVSLDALLTTASRESFRIRLVDAARRERAALVQEASGIVDPQLRAASALVRDPVQFGLGSRPQLTLGGSAALPSGLSVDIDAARTFAGRADPAALGTVGAGASSSWSLSMSQPLLEGRNQLTADWRALQSERTAASLSLARERAVALTEVEVAFWALAEAQAAEAVYRHSLAVAQQLLFRNREMASRDLVAEVDVLTARSGVAQREALLRVAQQERRDRSDALLLLVHGNETTRRLTADSLVKAADDLVAPSARSVSEIALEALPQAIRGRADLRAQEAMIAGARIRLDRALNATRPSLAVTGGVADGRTTVLDGQALTTIDIPRQWRVGLSLGLPVLNRRDLGASARASVALDVETLRAMSLETSALIEARTQWRAVHIGRERAEIAAQAASLAWEQLVAERRRLDLGLGDSFRLLQMQEDAVRAQLDAVQARYAVRRAEAYLRLALGVRDHGS